MLFSHERRCDGSTGAQPCYQPSLRCRIHRLVLGLVVLGLLCGCTVGPDFKRPQPEFPPAWHGLPSQALSPSPMTTDVIRWWTRFNDPTLNGLIQRAATANLDLQLAEAQIREARAARAAAAGGLGPSLDAAAAYQRSRTPSTATTGERVAVTREQYQAGFDAAWEIDLFGGQRRNLEAADADLLAAVESRYDVLVRLTAEVAVTYLQLRTGQQQLAITRRNMTAQQHTARLMRQRFEAGFVSGLDVASADAQAATTAAQIPVLESAVRQSIYSLGILMGEPPAALVDQLSPDGALPLAPPPVPLGLPSELVRRRPDIRVAEAHIHAATARIGVATAALFPTLTLTGSAGYRAGSAASLFEPASQFWSFGPSVSWRLFECGRLRAGVAVQEALTDQAFIAYRQTVLSALQEVENALVASRTEQDRRDALEIATAANRKAMALAEQRYGDGLTDYLNVLQAQQALLTTELALIQSQAAMATDLVALYKALGGGWEMATASGDASPLAGGAYPGVDARTTDNQRTTEPE